MTPEQAIQAAEKGQLQEIYLLHGPERYLQTRVIAALRAAVPSATPGLNDDEFNAQTHSIESVLDAARTMPMMAKRRWVLVRNIDAWDSPNTKAGAGTTKAKKTSGRIAPLDQLAAYCEAPSDTTVLVLTCDKLNGRRKLITIAKKRGLIVDCESPSRNSLPRWIVAAARQRGSDISADAAELVAEVAGPELAALEDVVERLTLYAGADKIISIKTVQELIPIVRPATVWQLVDAVSRRDVAGALAHLNRVYDPQDRGLRLLGVLAWSARQLLRFQAARKRGLALPEAAKAAGVPPFKARDLEQQTRGLDTRILENWLIELSRVDLRLKGGSKRPARAILETALIKLCSRQN